MELYRRGLGGQETFWTNFVTKEIYSRGFDDGNFLVVELSDGKTSWMRNFVDDEPGLILQELLVKGRHRTLLRFS